LETKFVTYMERFCGHLLSTFNFLALTMKRWAFMRWFPIFNLIIYIYIYICLAQMEGIHCKEKLEHIPPIWLEVLFRMRGVFTFSVAFDSFTIYIYIYIDIVLFRVFGCVTRGGARRGLCFKQDGWSGCSWEKVLWFDQLL